MSGSRPESVTRPPWLSFLMEPAWTALEQAEAALRSIEEDLLKLDPESFRRMREGVNGPGEKTKLATKTRTGETWIPVAGPSAEVSAPENKSSSQKIDPADAAWLASEQARLSGLEARELAEIRDTLRRELGEDALEALEAGDEIATVLREAGREHDHGLERLIARLRGFKGEDTDG